MARKTVAQKEKPKKEEKEVVDSKVEKTEKGKSIFYVVFIDTFISDSQILPKGVYRTKTAIERLDNSSPIYVKRFEGKIPDQVLHEVAKTLKLNVLKANGDYKNSEEILEALVENI